MKSCGVWFLSIYNAIYRKFRFAKRKHMYTKCLQIFSSRKQQIHNLHVDPTDTDFKVCAGKPIQSSQTCWCNTNLHLCKFTHVLIYTHLQMLHQQQYLLILKWLEHFVYMHGWNRNRNPEVRSSQEYVMVAWRILYFENVLIYTHPGKILSNLITYSIVQFSSILLLQS